jgi:hypothetical protein
MSSPASSGTDHCTKEKKAMTSAAKVWLGVNEKKRPNFGDSQFGGD